MNIIPLVCKYEYLNMNLFFILGICGTSKIVRLFLWIKFIIYFTIKTSGFQYMQNAFAPSIEKQPQQPTVPRTVVFKWVRLPPLHRSKKKKTTHRVVFSFWSRIRESNPPSRLGKPLYYRYTNPAFVKVL